MSSSLSKSRNGVPYVIQIVGNVSCRADRVDVVDVVITVKSCSRTIESITAVHRVDVVVGSNPILRSDFNKVDLIGSNILMQ